MAWYTDSAIILANEKSTFSHSVMNYDPEIPWADLSHFNAFIFKDEFVKTRLAEKYENKSFIKFRMMDYTY